MKKPMKRLLQIAAVATFALAAYAQVPQVDTGPAFHKSAPTRPQPAILSGDKLTGPFFTHPYQVTVYRMAAAVPNVLYQLPCDCRCDLALGHKSLRSCFQDTHGATCSVCMREGAFAYQQTQKGQTPAQIRAAIERGEYLDVNLDALQMPVTGS
jgi:hypothetical protein